MLRAPRPAAWALAVAAALAALACGDSKDDRVLGASCTQQGDCRFTCAGPSSDFPGGLCTVSCTRDDQCPRGGALCIDKGGGVCLFTCASDADCAFLGPAWGCKTKDRIAGGRANVCIGG
jgi:hypothetical protein